MKTSHYRVLAGLWTVGIVFAMSIPTGSFGPVEPALGFDKLVHAVLFAGFGGLWLRGLCPPESDGLSTCFWRRGGMLFGGGVLFAVGTEVYQFLIPIQRLADPYDAAADLVGFVLAFVGYYVYHVRQADRASA